MDIDDLYDCKKNIQRLAGVLLHMNLFEGENRHVNELVEETLENLRLLESYIDDYLEENYMM